MTRPDGRDGETGGSACVPRGHGGLSGGDPVDEAQDRAAACAQD